MDIITSDDDCFRSTSHELALATTESELAPGPLDALLELEDYLMAEHGMTFMQAVRAGVEAQLKKQRN